MTRYVIFIPRFFQFSRVEKSRNPHAYGQLKENYLTWTLFQNLKLMRGKARDILIL